MNPQTPEPAPPELEALISLATRALNEHTNETSPTRTSLTPAVFDEARRSQLETQTAPPRCEQDGAVSAVSGVFLGQSNSPTRTPAVNATHSAAVNIRAGPVGSWVRRVAAVPRW